MNNIVFTNEAGMVLKEKLKLVLPADMFVLVDQTTAKTCLKYFADIPFCEENIITISGGEHAKSLESVVQIWSVLNGRSARRNSVLVNIGGGLITDIGGFAASCFKRGIRCINVPTTLLAQVDASIGGKTGINFNGLKNEIGTFSNPEWVIVDNVFLKTLPHRQLMSGFAEMLKHALLSDEERLAEIMDVDLRYIGSDVFLEFIKNSVEVKDAIVRADPKEKGIRRALNLGHTVGHAIESVAIDHELELYHGDAIAYGMIVELYLSVKKLDFKEKYYEAIRNFIRTNYPRYTPVADTDILYDLMLHDKKNEKDGVNFTLLHRPGEFEIDVYCSKDEIVEALKQLEEM